MGAHDAEYIRRFQQRKPPAGDEIWWCFTCWHMCPKGGRCPSCQKKEGK